jgi:hypothetical protein
MVGTPSYDSRISFEYGVSLLNTVQAFSQRGIEWQPFLLGGCSIIEVARNDIVAQFLASDCTHLFMVDSDIGWRDDDLIRVLEADEPVVFASAPKRLSDDFAVVYRDGEDATNVEVDERGMFEIAAAGGAFSVIRRDALEKMCEAYPELEYRQGDGLPRWAFFLLQLTPNATSGADRALWGEDYAFCNRWRAIGGKVWIDPHIWLRHSHGNYRVEGCLADTIPAIRDHRGDHLSQSIWSLPSRGRPESMQRFIDAYKATDATCRVFVWIDSDDPSRPEYEKIDYPEHWIVETGPRFEKRCNGVIEEMFRRFPDASAYGFLADDLLPKTERWDARLVNAARRDRIAYGDDCLQREKLATHPVIGGDMARTIGWLVMPGVEQYFVDTALHSIAKATGRLVYVPDVVVEHLHPCAGKAPLDETYRVTDVELIEREQAAYERWCDADLPAIAKRVNEFGSMRNRPDGSTDGR